MEMARPAPAQPLKLLSLLFIRVVTLSLLLSPADGLEQICNYQGGNFTSNETYRKTLDSLLGSITPTRSDILKYRLFNASATRPWDPDDIQVLGVCSGDITGDFCWACLSGAAFHVRQGCPTNKQAALFDDKCWIRYSNVQLYGVLKMDVSVNSWYTENASDEGYRAALLMLLGRLRSEAASGGPIQKYAAGNHTGDSYTLYGMVQCSPDLSEQQCSKCLGEATWSSARGKVIGSILMPSCRSRFETYHFFGSEVPLATVKAVPGNHYSKTWIIVGALSGSAVVFCVILLTVKRKILPKSQSKKFISVDVVIPESPQFDLETIRAATENFSEANKLGQGGFGSVFRGKLPSGQEIAVKRLSQNSGQGESEFENEARLLLRLQHRNLVRLLGYCLEGVERLLVYDFVPNASLDKFLFDPLKRTVLDWDTRYKIITGITRGLLYLHEDSRLRIVHRDLKASNILLDMDMNPKISDFGMARLFELNQTQAATNRIMGTFGYMAPEYAARGKFSAKSDVFSFGVLVLEIVSGRRNLADVSGEDYEMLICQAWTNWKEGNISDIVDHAVSSGYSANILRCIHIGLLCVQEKAENRPEMISVIRWFDHHSITLPVPTQPAFFTGTSSRTRTIEASCSRNYAGTSSIKGASISELYPR